MTTANGSQEIRRGSCQKRQTMAIEPVDAPTGQPDTFVRVSKKRGKVEVQDVLPNVVVISRADLPPMLALADDLGKRREDRNAAARARRAERAATSRNPHLFDVY